MPIASLVIKTFVKETSNVVETLKKSPEVSIYASNENGDVIVVVETEDSDQMEQVHEKIKEIDGVISVHSVYLYYGDEFERIESGELYPEIRFKHPKHK